MVTPSRTSPARTSPSVRVAALVLATLLVGAAAGVGVVDATAAPGDAVRASAGSAVDPAGPTPASNAPNGTNASNATDAPTAAPVVAPVGAASNATAAPAPDPAPPSAPASGAPVRTVANASATNATASVTLVTGQTVHVVRRGNRTSYLVDAGVNATMRRVTVGGRTYVAPAWVDFSTFDRDLFDVERLLDRGVGTVGATGTASSDAPSDDPTAAATAGAYAGADGSVPVIVEFADRNGVRAVDDADEGAVATAPVSTLADGRFAPGRTLETVGAVGGTLPTDARAARALADDPRVERVWFDSRIVPALSNSTVAVGAPAARERYAVDGSGVTVAIVDSGIADDHPDLDDAVVAEYDATDDGRTDDPVGHGTHVAGTVAGDGTASDGEYVGVAPGASLYDVRVIDERGGGRLSWVIDGIEWAAANDADVASLSLGSSDPDGGAMLAEAVADATARGTLVVAAAGNEGRFASVTAPGNAPGALTVGAVTNDGALAPFSSRGPLVRQSGAGGDGVLKPDLVAPGVGVVSACPAALACGGGGSYVEKSGTSMATPHVSGVAALVAERDPDAGPERLAATLVSTARPTRARFAGADASDASDAVAAGAAGGDPLRDGPIGAYGVGAGRLDAGRALAAPVLVDGGAVDFGTVRTAGPVARTATVVNPGTERLRVRLNASLREVSSNESYDDAVALNRSTLSLAPGASADVRVRAAGLPDGLYAGRLSVATDADPAAAATVTPSANVTYGVPIAVGRPSRLTVEKVPAAGSTVENDTVHLLPYRAFDPGTITVRSLPTTVVRVRNGTATLDSYGGRYLAWSVARDETTNAQVFTHGVVNVTGDATLTLDERETVPYRTDTSAIEASRGPLANLSVQAVLQRRVDVPACGRDLPASRCDVEIELSDATAVSKPSRTVRYTPDPEADASVELLLAPAADWNGSVVDPTLDTPDAYHLIHATEGIDGPETVDVDPAELARVNRTYRRASPEATFRTESLVLHTVWDDDTDLGRLWPLDGRVDQSYYLSPEVAEYNFADRYESPTTTWEARWVAVPGTGERYERATNDHPLTARLDDWSLGPDGGAAAVSPLRDQSPARIDFADLADDVTVSTARDGGDLAPVAGTEVDTGAAPPGTTWRVRAEATQSSMPLSTRTLVDYRATAVGARAAGRVDDGAYVDPVEADAAGDGVPPRIVDVSLPVDGVTRLPPGEASIEVEVASADGVDKAGAVYAPATEDASPLSGPDQLTTAGAWREASTTLVGDPDGDGNPTLRVGIDAGVAAGGRLHLAIGVIDAANDSTRVLVENATAVRAGTAREGASVIVSPPTPATSVDDDPLYEDVDGDGEFTFLDVVRLLETYDTPVVQSNAARFDFDGSGSVDFLDVVALLDELSR